jgi:5'-3' exonuclease
MIALIDGDLIAHRCSASAEHDPLDVSLERADNLIDRICNEVGATSCEVFLTGSNSYRKQINPAYKANRKDQVSPRWLQDTREHLVVGWGARVSDGNEADDELGISQCSTPDDTIICSLDKDMLMIPGQHYSWQISGKKPSGDIWTKEAVRRTISPYQGKQNFYFQMIMGDSSDNIFGFDGKARAKVPQFLAPTIGALMECSTEREMWCYVADLYWASGVWDDADDILIKNAHCLYIQQSIGDRWQEPKE